MKKIIYLCACFTIFLLIGKSNAYEVHPMSLVLDEIGRGSSGTFRIVNTGERPLTFELSAVFRIYQDGYYDETVPADEAFMLMPPQAYIEPGTTQSFRVRYLGDRGLDKAVGYRVLFRQLPVDLGPIDGSGVQFIMHVHAPVYVVPAGVRPELSTDLDFTDLYNETRFETHFFDLDNPLGVIVIINHGDGLADLARGQLELTFNSGETRRLNWQQFGPAVFVRHILPDGESRIPVEALNLDTNARLLAARFISNQ